MMETKYLEIKNDCMWNGNGNCDRKCLDYKMDSFISKSSLTNDLYLNLCGGHMFTSNDQDTLDFLDSLETDDFNVSDLLINSNCTSSVTPTQSTNLMNNTTMNNIQPSINQIENNSYYQCNQNYSSTNLTNTTNIINNQLTNQTQQIKLAINSPAAVATTNRNNSNSNNFNLNTTQNHHQAIASQHQSSSKFQSLTHSTDTSSLLSSSLDNDKNNSYLNDLLLNSNSANIILTQHNQPVDNSSQLSNVVNSNQINYHHSNDDNLTNLTNSCTDLVVSSCSNDDLTDLNQTGHFNTHLQSENLNQHQFNSYQISNNMSSNYAFDHQLMDSTFCSSAVSCDSVGSSNSSECSNSVFERNTDYDTDDIEDDLDLLEDIIEEECDEMPFINQYQAANHNGYSSRSTNCHSIANSLESSSSDFEMIASPISDSLINDHSYGAIDKLTINPKCISLNSSSIKSTNLTKNSITITTSNNNHNIRTSYHETEINSKSTKISKRRSLGNLTTNNNQTNRKNMQRRSGTSLLMKEKQSKIKKVMDTERRKEHNESERMRRGVLKNAFLNLRNRCPKLQNSAKKSSRIQILNEATSYIRQMIDKGRQLENLKQQELQRKMELLDRLKGLSGN